MTTFRDLDGRAGAIIIGGRRYGKTRLAERLYLEMRACEAVDAILLDARSLRPSGGNPERVMNETLDELRRTGALPADREIEVIISRAKKAGRPVWWVVDDWDVLLASASKKCIEDLARALGSTPLRLVLLRNRFVHELEGWFASQEAPLREVLASVQIQPASPEQSVEIALSMLQGNFDAAGRAEWLAAWSGGIPGLLWDLKPLVPAGTPVDHCPPKVAQFIASTVEQTGLAERAPVLRGLLTDSLPPRQLLDARSESDLGSLMALGAVASDFESRKDPFQGRFWREAAIRAAQPLPVPAPEPTAMALLLEDGLRRAHLVEDFCDASGFGQEKLLDNLERTLRWSQGDDLLLGALVEGLGRRGLKLLAEAIGCAAGRDVAAQIGRAIFAHLGRATA